MTELRAETSAIVSVGLEAGSLEALCFRFASLEPTPLRPPAADPANLQIQGSVEEGVGEKRLKGGPGERMLTQTTWETLPRMLRISRTTETRATHREFELHFPECSAPAGLNRSTRIAETLDHTSQKSPRQLAASLCARCCGTVEKHFW